jgi:S-disulfanyl-L-cysteine oxidoreductase SoxD
MLGVIAASMFSLQAFWVPAANAALSAGPASTQLIPGATAYAEHCASCHGEKLTGSTHAPSLKGEVFLISWTGKTSRELYRRIISTMPLTDPGSLDSKVALAITVFILSANEQALPASEYISVDELNAIQIRRGE